jgi:hypothetical protein
MGNLDVAQTIDLHSVRASDFSFEPACASPQPLGLSDLVANVALCVFRELRNFDVAQVLEMQVSDDCAFGLPLDLLLSNAAVEERREVVRIESIAPNDRDAFEHREFGRMRRDDCGVSDGATLRDQDVIRKGGAVPRAKLEKLYTGNEPVVSERECVVVDVPRTEKRHPVLDVVRGLVGAIRNQGGRLADGGAQNAKLTQTSLPF